MKDVEEIKRRINEELDFAIQASKNKENTEDIRIAYEYKCDAYEAALRIIEEETTK